MQYSVVSSSVVAIKWGRECEHIARNSYTEKIKNSYQDFKVSISGLVIHPDYPYLGASPDGVISCSCCEPGLIEIKCPYKYRNESPIADNALSHPNYCLIKEENGTIHLSHNHEYYHQIQAQIAICESQYCDFICWTTQDMHIERILPEYNFMDDSVPILKSFFCDYILPEILTQKFLTNGESNQDQPVYCSCQKEESGKMVACEQPQCPYQWFHFSCVGLTRKPEGKWYCPDCKKK